MRREKSGVTSSESCVLNELRLKVSDAPNEVNTELRARRVFSRLPASSASSVQGGRLLKDRVTAMHERKTVSARRFMSMVLQAEGG